MLPRHCSSEYLCRTILLWIGRTSLRPRSSSSNAQRAGFQRTKQSERPRWAVRGGAASFAAGVPQRGLFITRALTVCMTRWSVCENRTLAGNSCANARAASIRGCHPRPLRSVESAVSAFCLKWTLKSWYTARHGVLIFMILAENAALTRGSQPTARRRFYI